MGEQTLRVPSGSDYPNCTIRVMRLRALLACSLARAWQCVSLLKTLKRIKGKANTGLHCWQNP